MFVSLILDIKSENAITLWKSRATAGQGPFWWTGPGQAANVGWRRVGPGASKPVRRPEALVMSILRHRRIYQSVLVSD